MRNSARKHGQNQSVKSRLKTLEKTYLRLVSEGKKQEAAGALRQVSSAMDKAAKKGVVHKGTVSRKKSRLSLKLNAVK